MKSLLAVVCLAAILTGCAVRTEIQYDPTTGAYSYSSGKNVVISRVKTANGDEQLIITSDASSVVQARGQAAVAVIDASGKVVPIAANSALGGAP